MCSLGEEFPWAETRRSRLAGNISIRREPVGVVAAIVPWNAPLLILLAKVVPALLVGCTVVVKLAPEATGSTNALTALIDASGLPRGVFNVVAGAAASGAWFVAHPGIDKVTFTGSSDAGRHVAVACARDLKRVTLELGGESAAIVLEDAETEHVLAALRTWSFTNSGQSCPAQTRILAPRGRHNEFAEALGALADGFVVGDPHQEATDLGPLVSERQRERVLGYIRSGMDEGATLVAGGLERPSEVEKGWYVKPTVFARVDNGMTIARDEISDPWS